jgi:predicted membrane channel-forming protein YqfA (hemolysin III family)
MKNKLKFRVSIALGALFAFVTPYMLFAQETVASTCGGTEDTKKGTIGYIICKISVLLNTIIPILIVLGVIYFIWGVITYVLSKDEEAKTRGRSAMIYGLIGLLVIVSIWGLIAIVKRTFGVTDSELINIPCIETPGVVCPP